MKNSRPFFIIILCRMFLFLFITEISDIQTSIMSIIMIDKKLNLTVTNLGLVQSAQTIY